MKKIKEDGRTYNRERIILLESYGPKIRPCKLCGYPTLDGYCCTYCGGDDSLNIPPATTGEKENV